MSKAIELLRRVVKSGRLAHDADDEAEALEADICAYLKSDDSVQLIIAGSYREAAIIARLKGVRRYTYIPDCETLEGARRGGSIWLGGTYHRLPRWWMLHDQAIAHGYALVEIDE